MIKFYQPWCGHCMRLKPDWDRLAEVADESVFIADVNCSEEPRICRANGVSGYPTIKVYLDGEVPLYDAGRSFEEMEYYVDEFLALHCDITRPSSCDAKSQTYLKMWKTKSGTDVLNEVVRLGKLMERNLTYELKRWMKDRISILKQLNLDAEGDQRENRASRRTRG